MDFIAEFEALKLKTPRIGSIRLQSINSEYTHNTDQCKNCYLLANAVGNEDCMYGRDFYGSTDCVDCDHVKSCTLCYWCINCKNCYNCTYLHDCNDCSDCDFSYFLKGCKNCIGCVNLKQQEYCIFNEKYSKEEFERIKKGITKEEISRKFQELQNKSPHVNAVHINDTNSFGDYINHCKNVFFGFDIDDCEDCCYIEESKKLKDCMDITILEESTLCYEVSSAHILNNCNFCFGCVNSSDCDFCELIMNSKYCFGCVSLNHKEFYILNKPYSREEYFKKVAEIKAELRREGKYNLNILTTTYPPQDTVLTLPRL
ncbi:MAG: hypothetical protein WCT53_03600 [Candidatus Gracilibacteria bacterium]